MPEKKPLYLNIIDLMQQKAKLVSVSSQCEKELIELGAVLVQSRLDYVDRAGAIMLLQQIAAQLPQPNSAAVLLLEFARELGSEPIPRRPSLKESFLGNSVLFYRYRVRMPLKFWLERYFFTGECGKINYHVYASCSYGICR